MLSTIAGGVKDITLGIASCIPIIGPCVVVPARLIASVVTFAGKATFYGVKTVVMLPVKAGSAVGG
ncbi:MAG: hypothetical protein KGQ54_06290, partial [Verrucomicrobia bacterium]|nr:hypothetical protein [Verrucomicrobiota bacterium]